MAVAGDEFDVRRGFALAAEMLEFFEIVVVVHLGGGVGFVVEGLHC